MRLLAWPWILASATLAAQQTTLPDTMDTSERPSPRIIIDPREFIAVDLLDPAFDRNNPRYRRLLPETLRETRPPSPMLKSSLGAAFSVRENQPAIELTFGEQPALGETLGMRVNRLEIEPAVVNLTVGDSFSLDQLIVRAYDADGEFVEHAPLQLEIEGPQGFIDPNAFELDGKTLSILARGIGRLWVTSILPGRLGENFSLPMVVVARNADTSEIRLSSRVYENVPASPP